MRDEPSGREGEWRMYGNTIVTFDEIARRCYTLADAMLAARDAKAEAPG